MAHAAGNRVGRFTLVEIVARGASGNVWRATGDEHAGDLVAIKIFDRPDQARAVAERLAATAAISGVIDLVDSGDGWVATRWIDGRTLADLIESEGPLPADRARRLIDQLATTVDQLHSIDLVHGALHPAAAIVDASDQVTLLDLGSATAAPQYTAPEVVAGAPVDRAADRYSLAVIAYEALTGESPFPPATSETARDRGSSRPVPVSQRTPSLSTHFDRLFERALSKSPHARHTSAQNFATELRSPMTTTDAGIVARRWKLVTFAALAIAAVVMVALAVGVGRSDKMATPQTPQVASTPTPVPTPEPTVTPTPTPVVLPPGPAWTAGMAASFACNLLALPDFEAGRLPDSWYAADDDNSIALIVGAGVDNSTALRVGAGTRYGIVAERVPVEGGQSYHFSAWLRRQGEPDTSGMWLEYETAAYVQLDGVEQQLFGPLDGLVNRQGRRVTRMFDVPPEAAWAMPTFFKDSSRGSLLVDEVVFGTASTCRDVPT